MGLCGNCIQMIECPDQPSNTGRMIDQESGRNTISFTTTSMKCGTCGQRWIKMELTATPNTVSWSPGPIITG